MNVLDRLKQKNDRAKVEAWLTLIGETDEACRAEVIEQCKADPEARSFYVSLYERDCNANR